jgi:lipopolysaccharide export system permease protein
LPRIVTLYIVKAFMKWIAITLGACLALGTVAEYLESLKLINRLDGSLLDAATITLLDLPAMALELSPFVFLFAASMTYIRLNDTSELTILRSAGLSVWQFSLPAVFVTFIASTLIVIALDPISSAAIAKRETILLELDGREETLNLLSTGVWFRQIEKNETYIIHGQKVLDPKTMHLGDVNVFRYSASGDFTEQLTASEAKLSGGVWNIKGIQTAQANTASSTDPSNADPIKQAVTTLQLKSSLQTNSLRERLLDPKRIPIWRLPAQIGSGELAGLNMTSHRVRLHTLLSTPIFLILMVMIAIGFSVPRGRIASNTQSIFLAVVFGFLAFTASQVVAKIAQLDYLPAVAAAWLPSAITLLMVLTMLLVREES